MEKLSLLNRIEGLRPYRLIRENVNRRLVRFFKGTVLLGSDNLVILEAACGSGYATHLLAGESRVKLSVGLDINLVLFKQGRLNSFKGGLVVGDIYNLPFRPGTFDLVWNSSSVEELPDPLKAIGLMARSAKRGGYVFVGVPYLYGPLGLYHLLPAKRLRDWVGRPFSYKSLRRLLEMNNLKVEKKIIYLSGFFIGVLARKIEHIPHRVL